MIQCTNNSMECFTSYWDTNTSWGTEFKHLDRAICSGVECRRCSLFMCTARGDRFRTINKLLRIKLCDQC